MPDIIIRHMYSIEMDGGGPPLLKKSKKPHSQSGLYVRDLDTGRSYCEICNKNVYARQNKNITTPAYCPNCLTCCIVCDDGMIRCRRLIGDEPWGQ